jgi:hypothetical protein
MAPTPNSEGKTRGIAKHPELRGLKRQIISLGFKANNNPQKNNRKKCWNHLSRIKEPLSDMLPVPLFFPKASTLHLSAQLESPPK